MKFWTGVLLLWSAAQAGARGQELLHQVNGAAPLEFLGFCVSDAGDVNRDGVVDYVVTAPSFDGAGIDRGRVLIYSGANRSLLREFQGAADGDWLGFSAAAAGDVDRDGFPDLLVGGHLSDSGAVDNGMAVLYSGRDGRVIWLGQGDQTGDRFGFCCVGLGDVDGDQVPDWAVTSAVGDANLPGSGMVRVFSGQTRAELYTLFGETSGDRFGTCVSALGDVDADGNRDLLIGAPLSDRRGLDSGAVYLYSGVDGMLLQTLEGSAPGDEFGHSVTGLSDLDGDLLPEILVGAPRSSAQGLEAGMVQLYSADGTLRQTWSGKPLAGFGWTVAPAGDFNGDGVPDFLVGSYQDDAGGVNAGNTRLISGSTFGRLYDFRGSQAGQYWGWTARGVGDVDGDGFEDIASGAPYAGAGGSWSGSAGVFGGNDLFLQTNVTEVATGGTITFDTQGGVPGNPTVLFLLEVGGASWVQPIRGIGTFDGAGVRRVTVRVTAAPVGIQAKFIAFAVGPGGFIDDSAEVTVTTR